MAFRDSNSIISVSIKDRTKFSSAAVMAKCAAIIDGTITARSLAHQLSSCLKNANAGKSAKFMENRKERVGNRYAADCI